MDWIKSYCSAFVLLLGVMLSARAASGKTQQKGPLFMLQSTVPCHDPYIIKTNAQAYNTAATQLPHNRVQLISYQYIKSLAQCLAQEPCQEAGWTWVSCSTEG